MPNTNTNLLLETRLRSITEEAREAGYAITWWCPEEVGDLSARKLIDHVVEKGNDWISYCAEENAEG